MSKKWVKEKKRDYYYKKAKTSGYRSRAAFKLLQLNKKFKAMKKGDRVLDIGAAPGGWMQMAGELVTGRGMVVGVDLVEIEPFTEEHLIPLEGDITDEPTLERIKQISARFDAVICDAAPDISGVWDIDHFNSIDLARHALRTARELLREDGNMLIKVFQGELIKEFADDMKRDFEFVKISKPKASRAQSAEVYIVGKGFLRTPVRYGDELEVAVEGLNPEGEGMAYVDGFKILIKDPGSTKKIKIRIKKVSKKTAWAVKV